MMRKILIVAVIAILLVAGGWYVLVRDDYTLQMTVTLQSRSSTGEVYGASIDMDVEDPEFIQHFFPATIGVDFPTGEHILEVQVYDLPHGQANKYTTGSTLEYNEHWYLGDIYGSQEAGSQEWTMTLDVPGIATDHPAEEGAVYLLVVVRYDNRDIETKHFTVNPDAGTVE